ncbi:DNA ligase 1-like [Tribolium madens]|uniref:DNA ligase 1-like n=1 Tax=Tribolium madens TaxID=41895 RepID=UPI001CF72099|nr:DNA ligase 1-like [Tribolium madens]
MSDFDEKHSTRVIRKIINSAIYVEKPLSGAVSSENTSIAGKSSNEDFLEPKTKRCTCSVDQKTCPFHASCFIFFPKETRKVAMKVSESRTKVSQNAKIPTEKETLIKNWKSKKDEERKKKDQKQKILDEAKMREKEKLLEQERHNFKKWLMNKKKLEEEAKRKKEKEEEEKQLKELEKEKRQLENQLNFQLWLKKKEENLEKKIKEQMKLINELERKETQLRENEKAFNEWLKNSKHRQKPLPLNKGLESLCSSTSVTYINPNPWNPNP